MTEPVYAIPLTPGGADGFLCAADVRAALHGVPPGSSVEVTFTECDSYDPSAPGVLARWLCGAAVRPVFEPSAYRIAEPWTREYDRAAAEYVAVEAGLLGRGA